ncbi:uncharacterized protein LOC126318639 [Schistocerca gregaria]|uniref:uncharacterized protein LOC126318639 n=1 Tax=Schistocerca gregaria TaxID=7010 RepID=UPI00211EA21F|nr:uncharacterized protein LOC126318639 [Schistocerca gregaria]
MKRSEDGGESGERWFMGVLALQRGRDVGLGAKFRADALRALARCNLDAVASPRGLSKGGALERAIKYLEQAQELHNEPVGQLLLIEAYWMAGRKEGDAMFEGVLNGRKVELSKCQSLMSAVTRSGRGEIVEAILERSMEEGKGWSENELSELRLMQLEVLVNAWKAAESTERLDCRLERVVDDCIRRCEEAETACEKNEQRLYVLCWELATECYKARKWTEAIRWFERVVRVGLSWAGREERVELKAKCLCLLAKCYLNLESLDEALKCGESALEAMPTFLPGLAVLFELYLKQDRIEGIHEVINKVMRIDEAEWGRCKEVLSPIYLIEMLIGQALEYQRSEVTLKVLEALLTAIGSREKTILQRLKLSYGFVLRTALKMMWTELAKCECRLEEDGEREGEGPKGASLKAVKEWINRAGYLIRKASQVLKKVGKVLFFGSSPLAESGPRQDEELTWMSHYSFNLAVKAQNYKLFENAHDLFIESAHFCKRTEVESAEPLKQQRKCRVLAISSILLMYTSSPYDASRGTKEEVSSSKMKKGLEGALQHVLLCYRLTERISEMSASTKTGETSIGADKVKVDCNNIGEDGRLFEDENSMRVLLFLLDFELRVLLRHPSQELFSLLNYREDFAEPHIMIRALENLSWFIWERHQGRYSLRLVGLELCYRLDALYRKKWSSSKSDQGGLGHDLLTWLSNLRRAVSFCPDKSESLQIYRRISELLTLKEGTREEAGASEDVQRQVQWLVIEAYNNGVYYSRLGKYEVSAKWLATAISLLPYYVQKNEFEGTLLGAHEQVLKKL